MTYNIRHGRGFDGRTSIGRIAQVIRRADVDVAALQEVDVGRSRSGGIDQAARLGELLSMQPLFAQTMYVRGGLYGNAVLSRWPARLVRTEVLPTITSLPPLEPRAAMSVVVETPHGGALHVVNTHLGLRRAERSAQIDALLSQDWLVPGERSAGTVLCGDFNCGPGSHPHRLACGLMRDAVGAVGGRRWSRTFPAVLPILRLDHLLVGPGIEVLSAAVPRDRLVRRASDHLPIVATLRLEGP